MSRPHRLRPDPRTPSCAARHLAASRRQRGSVLAQWSLALAVVGVVALAAINVFRG
jgi:hypothetical protein